MAIKEKKHGTPTASTFPRDETIIVNGLQIMERRRHNRYPFIQDILVGGTKSCTSTDICEGGIFISAVQFFEEGELVEVTIPVNEEKIEVNAQVRYYQPGIGAGIAFIDLNEDQSAKIRELIESLARKSG